MNWLVISPTYNQDFFTCMTVAFKGTLKETSAVQLERTKMYWKTKKNIAKKPKPNQIHKRTQQISFSNTEMLLLVQL